LAKGFFGKVLSLIGLESEEEALMEEDPPEQYEDEPEAVEPPPAETSRRRGSVVAITPPKAMRVVVVEPLAFDEVQAIALNLRNRRPVIVNLERTEREIAKRIVDFMSGATYALGGSMQRVGAAIFLFAPQNVDVAAQSREPADDEDDNPIWPPK
jgi:cell division inhibitor SepF